MRSLGKRGPVMWTMKCACWAWSQSQFTVSKITPTRNTNSHAQNGPKVRTEQPEPECPGKGEPEVKTCRFPISDAPPLPSSLGAGRSQPHL